VRRSAKHCKHDSSDAKEKSMVKHDDSPGQKKIRKEVFFQNTSEEVCKTLQK